MNANFYYYKLIPIGFSPPSVLFTAKTPSHPTSHNNYTHQLTMSQTTSTTADTSIDSSLTETFSAEPATNSVEVWHPENTIDVTKSMDWVRAQSDFDYQEGSPVQSLLDKDWVRSSLNDAKILLEKLISDLTTLFNQQGTTKPEAIPDMALTLITYAIGAVVVFAFIAVLYLLLSYLQTFLTSQPAQRKEDPRNSAHALFSSSIFHYQRARILGEKHNFNEAIYQIYLATLALLHEREWLRFSTSQTHHESLMMIHSLHKQDASESDIIATLSDFFSHYENVRFGSNTSSNTSRVIPLSAVFNTLVLQYDQLDALHPDKPSDSTDTLKEEVS